MDPVVAKITKPAMPGDYVVHWRAMADDGHVSNGAFGFKLKAAAH
jgi:methionine-rich copper-binding protein CopC